MQRTNSEYGSPYLATHHFPFPFPFPFISGSVMAWACMAASGTGSLVFIDDVTADKRVFEGKEVDCYAMAKSIT